MDVVWKKAQKEAAASLDQFGLKMSVFAAQCPIDLDWMMGDGFTLTEAEKMVLAATLPV